MRRCLTRAIPVALTFVFFTPQGVPCFGANPQLAPDDTETASMPLPPAEMGDIAMARREYVAAVQDYIDAPKNAEVWNKLGVAYHHLFAMQEAERAYKQALHMHHRYPQALNNLGAVFYAQHKYGKAERFYRRALRLNPLAAATYSNLGTAYFAQGRKKKGIAAYRKAFALNPRVFSDGSSELVAESLPIRERAEEDYCIARLFAEAGKLKQAIDYLRRALDEGFSNRGEIWHDQTLASLRATPAFVQLMSEEKIRR